MGLTHCKHGHEYTPENTRVQKYGSRQCKTCERLRKRAKYVSRPRTRSGPERKHTDCGTPRGYNAGCRCSRCKRDHAVVDELIVRAIAKGSVMLSEVPPLNRKEQTMLKRLRAEMPAQEQEGRIPTVGRGQLSAVGLGAWDWRR